MSLGDIYWCLHWILNSVGRNHIRATGRKINQHKIGILICFTSGEKVQGLRIWSILFLVIIFVFARTVESQIQSFLINCGLNSSVNVDGRRWIGDRVSGNNFTLIAPGIEASSTMFHGDPVYEPLYRTARIFTDSMNYSFQGTMGNYFFRLHFFPLKITILMTLTFLLWLMV